MRNILVTGAGGFIGYNLCNYMAGLGHRVRGIDVCYPASGDKDIGFSFTLGDFRDQGQMEKILPGIDVVFHLASAHLKISLDESEYWNVNVHSLRTLLKQSLKNGVQKFIHVSSVGVYGNLKNWPADENTTCMPQSVYGETKLAGEKEVRSFSEETGFPVVIIRPAWVYGPWCPRTLKLYKTLKKGLFFMIGKGDNVRHPVYILDMLESLCLAMEKKEAESELFVIGGPEVISTNELINTFCDVSGISKPKIRVPYGLGLIMAVSIEQAFGLLKKEPPMSRRTLEFFNTNTAFDISRAKEKLGFNPKYSFEDGLRDSQQWIASRE